MKYCIHCGAPVEDNAKFCTECGGKQELQDQPDSAAGSAYTGGNNASYNGSNSQPYTGGSNAAYNGGNSQQYTGGIPNYTAQPFTPPQAPDPLANKARILSVHFKAKGGSKTMAVIGIVLGSLSVVAALITLIMYLTGFVDRMDDFWSSWIDQLPME